MRAGKVAAGSFAMLIATLRGVPAAAEEAPERDAAALQVHGFGSQGFILSVGNDYLARDSTKGSFEFSELGLNVSKELTSRLAFGAQLIARDLGPSGNHAPQVDWFYVDYRWRDWLGLRAGRLKIPYGFYNEVQDIDAARVPILLPGSVYPQQGREVLFAHDGFELSGFLPSDGWGALEYRLFAGTIFWNPDGLVPTGSGIEADLDVRYVFGGRLLWETPLEGLRVAASGEVLRAEPTFYIAGLPAPLAIENRSRLWAVSAEYSLGDLMLTSEYSRWHADQSSDTPDVSPPLKVTSERGYAMAAYRLLPWLQLSSYYALHFPDTKQRKGSANQQHDIALTLRFDVNEHWLVKLEGHYLSGTAGLQNPVVIAPPDAVVEPEWAAFFAKTTAYF